MPISLNIDTKWIQNKIAWSLLIIPLCFKIEIFTDIIILPQEIILPFLIILYLFNKKKIKIKIAKLALPYIYLLLALILTAILTIFSLFQKLDIVGLLKLIKYSIYVISILIIYDYRLPKFVKRINLVCIITILLTLLIFYINKVNSGYNWSTFTAMATYISNYMPTGFSNRIFNVQSQSFVIYSGNHGIYGSYLVLILLLNISGIVRGTEYRKISYAVAILAFINIMLLTSRETFLLLFITFFSFGLYYISHTKFNPNKVLYTLVVFVLSIFLVIYVINFFEIELSIVNKVSNSLRKFREEGGDGSIDVRFNTWLIIFIYLFTHPWRLFIGTGFNPSLYREKLDLVAVNYPNIGKYVGIPENLFIQFLSYGGIFSLIFVLMFIYSLFKNLFRKINTRYCMLIPFYILGIFITNNTGASIIAELLMSQFAIIYLFIMNSYENKKHSLYNY